MNGWRIGDGLDHPTEDAADAADAAALHDLLDREVLPAYYDAPERWLGMMQASIAMAVERFSADRMVRDYFERLYQPERRRRVA